MTETGIFRMLGLGLLGYVAYGYMNGEIYARYRWWGQTFRRDEQPWRYWEAMISYVVLAMLLIFFFGHLRR